MRATLDPIEDHAMRILVVEDERKVARALESGLEIDVVLRRAVRAGVALHLTVREFEILDYLLRNQGNIVSREMLARDVWKENGRVTSFDNVVEVHIGRLRKKLDDPFAAKLLHTVRGLGYVLAEGQP